ncbi:MAG: oligosaccharide flippase family protein [Bacilli bacterium]
MTNKLRLGLRNVFLVGIAQSVSLVLGFARFIVLPQVISVSTNGYWQIYLLYLPYMIIISLGFVDGFYIRYGSYDHDKIPKDKFANSFLVYTIFTIIFSLLFLLYLFYNNSFNLDNRGIALFWVAINAPILCLTSLLVHVIQVTNQMKKYSVFVIVERLLSLIAIVFIVVFNINDFVYVIIFDTIARIIYLIILFINYQDLIKVKSFNIKEAIKECLLNIRIGLPIMFATITSALLLGYGKIYIENRESIEIYAIFSFAFSIISLAYVFPTAISAVIYPLLSRINKDYYNKAYVMLNNMISLLIYIVMLLYFPFALYIEKYMSNYSSVTSYLPIIFGIIFIESKMMIVINVFYKIKGIGDKMLIFNVISIVALVALINILKQFYNSVIFIVAVTFIVLLLRMILMEVYLYYKMGFNNYKYLLIETITILLFTIILLLCNMLIAFILYTIYLIIIGLIYRKGVIEAINFYKG